MLWRKGVMIFSLKEGKILHRQGFTSTTSNASLNQRRMRGAVDFRHRVSGLVQRNGMDAHFLIRHRSAKVVVALLPLTKERGIQK